MVMNKRQIHAFGNLCVLFLSILTIAHYSVWLTTSVVEFRGSWTVVRMTTKPSFSPLSVVSCIEKWIHFKLIMLIIVLIWICLEMFATNKQKKFYGSQIVFGWTVEQLAGFSFTLKRQCGGCLVQAFVNFRHKQLSLFKLLLLMQELQAKKWTTTSH